MSAHEPNRRLFKPLIRIETRPGQTRAPHTPIEITSYASDVGVVRLYQFPIYTTVGEKGLASVTGASPPEVDFKSVLIEVDGAVKKARTAEAYATFGVYFGPKIELNYNGTIPAKLPQTRQAAVLYAVKRVVRQILNCGENEFLCGAEKIVFLTDSAFLKDGVSIGIWLWERKEFAEDCAECLKPIEIFKDVHEDIKALEKSKDVKIWQVEKKYLGGAKALADAVL